jgi:hypothetical protein
MFSDRPCSPNAPAEQMVIAPPNEYTPSAPPLDLQTTPAPPVKKKIVPAADNAAELDQRKQERCRKLTQALQRVHSKLRAGYRIKEGERLRARDAQLSEDIRREQCR